MEFRKVLPSLALQPYVRNYWVFDVAVEDVPFSQLLFPFGAFELIFNIINAPRMRSVDQSSDFKQPDSLYLGQFTKPFILNFNQSSRCIGVSLQPWVGNLLFDIPAQEFKDKVTQVESIGDTFYLFEKLLETKNDSDCFHELELFLAEKFLQNSPDEVSHFIAKSIINNSSNIELKKILSNIGFTRRRIEQRFLESTGLPMGFFIRKIRFQKAVHLLQHQTQLSLTHIGLDAGYYDQNHFIKEFKEFSGITPKEFRKQHSEMKDFVSDLMMVNSGQNLIIPFLSDNYRMV